jgi:hypothetical protein
VEILPEYDLIDISSGKALKETGITTEITTESTGNTPEFNTQSKVKESKEKKSSSSADADERASSATRNDDDSLQKSSNNDFSGNDDFFEKMTDNDLNDAETLRDRIRMLFGYYTRKEPHPREVADVFALFGNPVYKKRTTLTIVLQAFREQPARSAERQNTRYLMKVIEGRLAEMRERTLAKRKQERQLMEYRASPGGGVASLDAMVNELKEVFDEEPRTVN